jgi:hypothetical protein
MARCNVSAGFVMQKKNLVFSFYFGRILDLKGTLVERELRQVLEDHAAGTYEFFTPKISIGTKQGHIRLRP